MTAGVLHAQRCGAAGVVDGLVGTEAAHEVEVARAGRADDVLERPKCLANWTAGCPTLPEAATRWEGLGSTDRMACQAVKATSRMPPAWLRRTKPGTRANHSAWTATYSA